ncbi:DUF402 domain-containing protein [[Mycoplasma] cavipharyngis]|uniref:DUF402 domain-containing protein n=1 Tax=[Mycoplasma] cavipharyngis TaxID=92757 RepID=UPI0037040E5D
MYKPKKYMIHAYKYNGWLYRIVESPYVLYETSDVLCLYLPVQSVHSIKCEEYGKRNFRYVNTLQKFWFFFRKKWFNIIVHIFEDRYSFYVNVASPYIIEENAIKYVDLDLDFKIQNNDSYSILDENELENNCQKWNYPQELLNKIEQAKNEVVHLIKSKWFQKLFNPKQLKFANQLILKKFADYPELCRSLIYLSDNLAKQSSTKPATIKNFTKKSSKRLFSRLKRANSERNKQ